MIQDKSSIERTIKVRTVHHDNDFYLKFQTSQQYNKVYYTLMEKSEDSLVSVDNQESKADIHSESILFFYYPDTEINWYADCMRNLTIVFEDRQKINILVQGTKRAKNAYDTLRVLLNKEPTGFFISLLQEDNKYALIKHYTKIKEIFLTEATEQTKQQLNE